MSEKSIKTKLTHLGRDPKSYYGLVNPPVAKNSTFIYPSLEVYKKASSDPDYKYRYGRMGNPMADAFECAITELDGGFKGIVAPSGLAACTLPFLAFMKQGGHVLITDSVYDPIRGFCKNLAKRFGVEVEYYDPLIGCGIEKLIKDNTCIIYMESPGSATFEVQDVRAITQIAKEKGVVTALDNTWSTPLYFKPLDFGVDIAIQSATKYIGGHADITLGVAVAKDKNVYDTLKACALDIGYNAGADDIYLALRGLRTLEVRMRENLRNAKIVAKWLQERSEIARVFYPVLEDDPNHTIWKRDFKGAAGVFSIDLLAPNNNSLHAFADALDLFPVGSSWGGYESLMQPQSIGVRTFKPEIKGTLLRLQIGLEDPQDLIASLTRGFEAMKNAS